MFYTNSIDNVSEMNWLTKLPNENSNNFQYRFTANQQILDK